MHTDLAREHDRQPSHHEGDRNEGQGRKDAYLPADVQPAQEASVEEEAAEQSAHPNERGGKDFERRQRISLIAP